MYIMYLYSSDKIIFKLSQMLTNILLSSALIKEKAIRITPV